MSKHKYLTTVAIDRMTEAIGLIRHITHNHCLLKLCFIHDFRVSELALLRSGDQTSSTGRRVSKAKTEGKYRGRVASAQKHELIRILRPGHGKSLRETAHQAGVSKMTVLRVCSDAAE